MSLPTCTLGSGIPRSHSACSSSESCLRAELAKVSVIRGLTGNCQCKQNGIFRPASATAIASSVISWSSSSSSQFEQGVLVCRSLSESRMTGGPMKVCMRIPSATDCPSSSSRAVALLPGIQYLSRLQHEQGALLCGSWSKSGLRGDPVKVCTRIPTADSPSSSTWAAAVLPGIQCRSSSEFPLRGGGVSVRIPTADFPSSRAAALLPGIQCRQGAFLCRSSSAFPLREKGPVTVSLRLPTGDFPSSRAAALLPGIQCKKGTLLSRSSSASPLRGEPVKVSVRNPTADCQSSSSRAAALSGIQCQLENLSLQGLQAPERRARLIALAAADVASAQAEEENPASVSGEGGGEASSSSGGRRKASGQLARWARARKIRAGKLAPSQKKSETVSSLAVQDAPEASLLERESAATAAAPEAAAGEEFEEGEFYGGRPLDEYEKSVYMVSDGTGWTADRSVHAALGQFEHCMVDSRCSVNTHLFSDVNDVDRLMGIIRHAGLEGGMVVYTLADPTMAEAAKQACELLRVPHIDILGPITEALANHLGVSPLGLPRGAPGRKMTLSKQYFKRIEAVEFTIKQDDGALPKNLHLADVVLVGVSRTSKTPLSTYIAQKGYKVANVPLVFGIGPPKELFEVDQDKVFGLTINANFLKAIRLARYRHLGVAENSSSSYSDMEHIRRELEYSRKLFSQNPRWPVVEVTGKAIEETAAVILRMYYERRNKFSMPRISTRY